MKNLIIIGASGFGREVSELAKCSVGYGTKFIIKGFIDDNLHALDGFKNYPPILASVNSYKIVENDVFICAVGFVEIASMLIDLMLQKGAVFYNLIHKKADVMDSVSVGVGVMIAGGSIISSDVEVGDFCQIMSNVIIGHDTIIGNYCRIGDFAFIGGNAAIGNNIFIAVRSTILQSITIIDNCTIGVGSIVIKNIKKVGTYYGNPAKKIF